MDNSPSPYSSRPSSQSCAHVTKALSQRSDLGVYVYCTACKTVLRSSQEPR